MSPQCAASGCSEAAVASLEALEVCRAHFLASAYEHLQSIAAQIHEADFHIRHAESAGRCLEQCMREAANIACSPDLPSNLERAQVLDILLWASELYGRLRRGPRVLARVPILVRSEDAHRPWEEKTETRVLSLHGFSFVCRHEVRAADALTCVRLDTGLRGEARVAWVRQQASGENLAGVEFTAEEDFWGLESGSGAWDFPSASSPKPRP